MKKDLAAMDGAAPPNAREAHLSASSCSIQASYPKLAPRPPTPDAGRRKSVFNFAVGTTSQPAQPQPPHDGEAKGSDAEGAAARLGPDEMARGEGGGEAATGRSEAATAEGGEKAAAVVAAAATAVAGGGGDSAPVQRKGSIGTRVRKMSRELIGLGGGAEPTPRGAPQSLPSMEALRRSGAGGAGGALEAMALTLGAAGAASDHLGTQDSSEGGQDAEVAAAASEAKPNPWARVRSHCGPQRRLSHAEQYIEEVTSEVVVPRRVREGTGPRPRLARLATLGLAAIIEGSTLSLNLAQPGSHIPSLLTPRPSPLAPSPSPRIPQARTEAGPHTYENNQGTATHTFRAAARERAGTSLQARLKRAAELAKLEKQEAEGRQSSHTMNNQHRARVEEGEDAGGHACALPGVAARQRTGWLWAALRCITLHDAAECPPLVQVAAAARGA